MTEKKLKLAAKKATPSKTGIKKSSSASSKPKVAKVATAKNTPAKKPAAKKTAVKKTVAKKAAAAAAKPNKAKTSKVVKAPAAKAAKPDAKPVIMPSPEERYRMVETAAYFIAEQHGFQGRSDEHWVTAERQIAAKLGC